MAIVGEAHIIVRAITDSVEKDIRDSFNNVSDTIAKESGKKAGNNWGRGFNSNKNMFTNISEGLKGLVPEAEGAANSLKRLHRVGMTLEVILSQVAGAIGAVVVSIGPLIANLAAAVPAAMALANGFLAIKAASFVAGFATKGVMQAVSSATRTTGSYAGAVEDLKEKLQQLRFESEEAALSEERAALNLEKARENLLRVQDLPPNSMARREAELAYKEAELSYRRAKDRAADLNEELKKGPEAAAAAGGADPYAGLTKSQKAFAKFLVSLKPKIDELREAVASSLLPAWQTQIDRLVKRLFPTLKAGLSGVAESVGVATGKITDFLDTEETAGQLAQIFEDMKPTIESLGQILADAIAIFMDLVEAAEPVTSRFFGFIETAIGDFADTIDRMNKDGSLTKFFNDAGDIAADWGEILGNVFGGFGQLIKLTTGPGSAGEYMLTWFKEASEGFANLGKDDPEGMKTFFKDAMVNTRAIFSAIGKYIGEILKIADNPAIKETFDALGEGAPVFGRLLESGLKAGPAFAELITNIMDIGATFQEMGATQIFFQTLADGAKVVADFLKKPEVQDIIKKVAPILAFLSAVSLMFGIIKFAFFGVIGFIASAFSTAGKVVKPFFDMLTKGPKGAGAGAAAKGGFLGNITKTLKAGGIVGLIIFVISKIVEFYNKFDDFKATVDNTLGALGESFGGLWESIGGLFENIFGGDGIGGLIEAFDPILKFFLQVLIPILGATIGGLLDSLSSVIDFISNTVGILFDSVGLVVEGILDLFKGDFQSGFVKIFGGIGIALLGIVQFIVNGVITIINTAIIDRMNSFINSIANGPIGQFVKDTFGLDVSKVKISKLALVDWTGDARKNLDKYLAQQRSAGTSSTGAANTALTGRVAMASGGIVRATMGGVAAVLGEGGQNERVEPLDENGLSRRDKAMIDYMSSGKAGGITVHVHAAPGMSTNELVEKVSRKIAFKVQQGVI